MRLPVRHGQICLCVIAAKTSAHGVFASYGMKFSTVAHSGT